PSQLEDLLLAPGEVPRVLVSQMDQAHRAKHRFRASDRRVLRFPDLAGSEEQVSKALSGSWRSRHHEVLEHRHVPELPGNLKGLDEPRGHDQMRREAIDA